MKKITLSVFILSAVVANAQLPVSHIAGKKKALIEEFTGIHCQYCPDGHKRSDDIVNANPTNVFSVNIHAGTYAPPNTGELDFRTIDGNAILAMPNMGGGYPKGDVNRAPCASPITTGSLTMGRDKWAAAVAVILNQNSYINIAGSATLNTTTRVLTVDIEAYYTGNGPSANYLTVMLKQDNILGTQSSGSTYPAMWNGSQYKHNHALRDVITSGYSGQLMNSPTIAGTTYTTTIYYTVPTTYVNIPVVLSDLDIVAFISESNGVNIMSVCKVPITTTATSVSELSHLVNAISVFPNPVSSTSEVSFNLVETTNVSVTLSNMVGQTVWSQDLGELNAGVNDFSLDAANLQNGLYLMSITAGNSTITKRVNVSK